jgi:5-formyltetrahydrofolate cyclo-ligase
MSGLAKPALREAMQARLATLDIATRVQASARATQRVLSSPEVAHARRVFLCLSFGIELDTRELVETLLAEGREVYVPRAEPRDRQLHVHRYPCDLVTLPFGLRQPRRGAPEVPLEEIDATLDVALVLGLAFDRRGYRLGYGSGYFDRFLAGRPFPALGLAFEQQMLDRLPQETHDIPMRAVITDASTHAAPR